MFWEKENHHTGSIYAIDWSKSKNFIATGSNDKMIKIVKLPEFDNEVPISLIGVLVTYYLARAHILK